MTSIEDITFRQIPFDPDLRSFSVAVDQFYDYEWRERDNYFLTRNKANPDRKYQVQIEEGMSRLRGRCNCPQFSKLTEDVCKHVYILAFSQIAAQVNKGDIDNWSECFRYMISADYYALQTIPKIDNNLLSVAYQTINEEDPDSEDIPDDGWEEPEPEEPEPEIKEPTVQEKAFAKGFKDATGELDKTPGQIINETIAQTPVLRDNEAEEPTKFEDIPEDFKPQLVRDEAEIKLQFPLLKPVVMLWEAIHTEIERLDRENKKRDEQIQLLLDRTDLIISKLGGL